MYHSVVKVKRIAGLSFSKLNFQVASVYAFHKAEIRMLQKVMINTLSIKKCKLNKKQSCKQVCMTKNFDIG